MKETLTQRRKAAKAQRKYKRRKEKRTALFFFSNLASLPLCAFALFFLIFLFAFQSQAQTYVNPVIPGDFPDPSVIRVGEDYYATATTGGWSPHFPLLRSKDLINWEIIGAVFSEKPAWAKGDFWAPEIIADKNRYFVYYTARRDEGKNKKGTLCVAVATAEKPQGPYTDKGALICQEMGSIDAFYVRDENDKPFLIWKEDGNDRQQPTWLYAQQLDESGTKLIGKAKKMFRNDAVWENHVVEGSFIIRRDGWFYHFYSGNACCGRGCNYALGVARSKTLLGKWEKNPANPVLAANQTWQCPGHGSIVETPDGRDFLLYHAYRKRSDAFNIGREALLDEVKFRDGWAVINEGRGASNGASVPIAGTKQRMFFGLNDEFNENLLAPKWTYPLYNLQNIRLDGGFLTIAPAEKQLTTEKMPEIVVAERTVSGTYTATTRIDYKNLASDEFAGISAYSWRTEAVGISLGNGKIFTWRRAQGKNQEISSAALPKSATAILLRIDVQEGENFQFSFSTDGKSWQTVGDKIITGNVEGARVALIYNGRTTVSGARFDWLRVEPK
ncbi:MAG TPA: family 43 glycosylhydrolase [Pyrinomonadaceae bacterium]|jgi:beta-xylosidase